MSIFTCAVCGHVEFDSSPESCPVCAAAKFEQNDKLFEESMEQSKEGAAKHIPGITVNKDCKLVPGAGCIDVLVMVGEVVHPMEEAHHIMYVDCYVDNKYVSRQMLTPGVYPGSLFHIKQAGSKVKIVERCNKHGFWMAEADI
ncbi:MAG: hypothetical protein GF401_10190 [Chitinivibrionales bacterium]|nr:hypothetical protein [Chitinivibrionales bacterium]